MKQAFILLAFCICCVACSKNSSSNDDKELPVITLTAPLAGQTFPGGFPIAITGTVSDNNRISEIHVHISNAQTGALLIDVHRYPDHTPYALNEAFLPESGITYRIQVIAKDNAANENRATLQISAN